jgi:hypothetical protein
MIAKYNRKSLAFGIPGISLQLGWFALLAALAIKDGGHGKPVPEWVATLFVLCMFLGAILWLVGCCYYAMAKGYRATVGFLGIFSWIGLLILFVLPDKAKGQNDDVACAAPEPN